MCTVASTTASLGRPAVQPVSLSISSLLFPIQPTPPPLRNLHTHAFTHTYTHTCTHLSSLPQCVLPFPTHQFYLCGTFLQALTQRHSCTRSHYSHTLMHTHIHVHTYPCSTSPAIWPSLSLTAEGSGCKGAVCRKLRGH